MARLFLSFLILSLWACSDGAPAPGPGGAVAQAVGKPSAEAIAAYQHGRELFVAEQLPAAATEIQRALTLAPDWAEAHLAYGKLLIALAAVHFGTATYDRGRLEQAIAEFARAGELDPKSQDLDYWTGEALFLDGRNEEAARRFEAALAANPQHAKAAKELGLLLAAEGDPTRAREFLTRARELLPKDDQVLFQLGLQLEALEDEPGAEAAYREALAINPAHPGPLTRLVALYQRRGDKASAQRAAEDLARVREFGLRLNAATMKCQEKADDPALLVEVAKLYREVGMKDAARTWCQRALRLAPEDPAAKACLESLQ